jgi:tetratricopeptide (TPR) repeat protein
MATLREAGQIEEFLRVCEHVREEPPAPDPGVAAAQDQRRAIAWRLLAVELQRQGKLGPALEASRASVALGERLAERNPGDRSLLADLAMALHCEAYFAGFNAPDADYAPLFVRSVDLLEQTIERSGGTPGARSRLATVLSSWAHVETTRGKFTEARDRADRAHRLWAELTSAYPFRAGYCMGLLMNAQRLAWVVHRKLADEALARSVLEESIRTGRQGLERLPGSDLIAFPLAILESELGRLLGERGDPAARAYWASARALWEPLLSAADPQLAHVVQAGAYYDQLARYELGRGETAAAEAATRSAVGWHRTALARTGGTVHSQRLGSSLSLLAQILITLERPDEALAALAECVVAGACNRETLESPVFAGALGGRPEYRGLLERAAPPRAR